jgi:hypothetical protein
MKLNTKKKLKGFCYAICHEINSRKFSLDMLPGGTNVGKRLLIDVL